MTAIARDRVSSSFHSIRLISGVSRGRRLELKRDTIVIPPPRDAYFAHRDEGSEAIKAGADIINFSPLPLPSFSLTWLPFFTRARGITKTGALNQI